MSDLNRFLSILFDRNESVWVKRDYSGVCHSIPLIKAITTLEAWRCLYPTSTGTLIGLNPAIQDGLPHQRASTDTLRNFLIEMDHLTFKEQVDLIVESKLPFSAATFSGNKSIHFVISLEEPVTESEYKIIANKLKYAFGKCNDEWLLDPNALRPEVSTRIGTFTRLVKNNESEQRFICLRDRVNNDSLYEWLDSRQEIIERWKETDKVELAPQSYSNPVIDLFVRTFAKNSKRMFCPSCRSIGKDSTGDHLWIFNNRVYCNLGCDFESIKDNAEKLLTKAIDDV